jgi:hypothetical protein
VKLEAPDRPADKSPVGLLVARLKAKNPEMDDEEARTEAHRLLDKAAGKRNYRLPRVSSPGRDAPMGAETTVGRLPQMARAGISSGNVTDDLVGKGVRPHGRP